jgi:aminoglycoside 3-N-acetyltransferase
MNKNEIKKALREFGLGKGNIVLVHSSLASIGHVDGGADTVIDAFLETIGNEGTLVVPVFGNLGILTEKVKKRPRAVVSDCPKGTVAAIGADAEFICRDHWKADTAHGHDTPYLRIAGLGGYICLLGVDQDRNTTLHSVEALLELPYLQNTSANIETENGTVEKTWKYYPGPHRDFIGLDKTMRLNGKMKIGKIGNAAVRLMKSKDLIDTFVEIGKKDSAFCLCDNENCTDCVRQRAAIRKAELAREDFKLAAASSIAGRYIPEMVENLKAAGIEYVELDIIQGKPAHMQTAEKLKKAVIEFTEENIKVTALRLPAALTIDEFDKVLEKTVDAGIKDLIMPLTENAPEYIKSATNKGMDISFINQGISALRAAEILGSLTANNHKAGFVFSPVNFVKAGEMPFLQSFRQGKFRKYITRLDVEDACFDGMPAAWGHGNAEIKELISILRCASFSGFMTVSGRNRKKMKLAESAQAFAKLLEEI